MKLVHKNVLLLVVQVILINVFFKIKGQENGKNGKKYMFVTNSEIFTIIKNVNGYFELKCEVGFLRV